MENKKIDKPWGYEIIWAQTDNYIGKFIHIEAGKRLSRQYHRFKEETISVLNGSLILEINQPGTKEFITHHLLIDDSFHIPPGLIHRMEADQSVGHVDLVEISTNHLYDVIRLEDDYGRK